MIENTESKTTALAKPMSRRVFLSMTAVTGALTFKGALFGGTLQAWADESNQVYFVVYILSKFETPIMAYDLTSGSAKPLPNCKVTVYSIVSKTSKTVTTNEEGFAPLNIYDMSNQYKDDSKSTYNFWGKITAECDGYRQYYEDLHWVQSGVPADENGVSQDEITIPTQIDDGTSPYLRSLTLDGFDIQYAQNNVASVYDASKTDRVIRAEIATHKAGAEAVGRVYINGFEKVSQTATASNDGHNVAVLTFTDKWLAVLKPGDTLAFQFGVNGEQEYRLTTPMTFSSAVELGTNGQTENQMMSLGTESGPNEEDLTKGVEEEQEKDSVPAVSPWLCMDGDRIWCCFPFIPISFFYDYLGHVGFRATLLELEFTKNYEEEVPSWEKRFDTCYGLTGKKAWNEYTSECSKAISAAKAGGMRNPLTDGKAFAAGKLSRKMSFAAEILLYGAGICNKESSGDFVTSVDFGLLFELSMDVSGNVPFSVYGVPMYWGYDVTGWAELEAVLCAEIYNLFEKVEWPTKLIEGVPISVVFGWRLEAGLSCGVGVSGIASLGVRGYGYIENEFVFDYAAITGENEKAVFPEVSLLLGCHVQLYIQIFFLKAAWSPSFLPDYMLYDNTHEPTHYSMENSNLNSSLRQRSHRMFNSDGSLVDASDFTIVTDEELKLSVESTGTTWSPHALLSGLLPSYTARSSSANLNITKLAKVLNPYTSVQASAYNPINGLMPTVEEKLWEGCFSNPRIRIVHTNKNVNSSSSFANDRCFLIRIAVVKVTIPETAGAADPHYRSLVIDPTDPKKTVKSVCGGTKILVKKTIGGNAFVEIAESGTASTGETVNRTRLTISEWDHNNMTWGEANVVDFIADGEVYEVDRMNAYDIDFDVDVDSDDKLIIAITSMERSSNSSSQTVNLKKYLELEKSQYVSLVRWDPDTKKVIESGSTRSYNVTGSSLFHPRIMQQYFDDGNASSTDKQNYLVYSYVCDYKPDGTRDNANFAVTVFGKNAGTSKLERKLPPTSILSSDLANLILPETLVTGTFEVACPDRTKAQATDANGLHQSTLALSWSRPPLSKSSNALSIVCAQTFSIKKTTSGTIDSYTPIINMRDKRVLNGVGAVTKLSSLDQRGLFSFADTSVPDETKPLKVISLDKDNLTISITDNSGKTSKVQYFSSFNGRRLYTVRSMQGTSPALTDKAKAAIANGANVFGTAGQFNSPSSALSTAADYEKKDVELYQLCEARWVDELQTYYDFYPIAQLKTIPDNIGVVATNDTRTDFTFATITDFDKSKADLYQVAVPKIMSAKVANAASVSPYTAAGDKCWYYITILNTGNAPITYVKMQVTDKDGNALDTQEFADLAPYVQGSADNIVKPYNEDGSLKTDENGYAKVGTETDARDTAGILWPGKKRTYKLFFMVPADLDAQGDTQFGVKLINCEDRMDDDASTVAIKQFSENKTARLMSAPSFVSMASSNVSLMADEDRIVQPNEATAGTGRLITSTAKINFAQLVKVMRQGDKLGMKSSPVGTAKYAIPGSTDATIFGATGDKSGDTLRTGLFGAALGAIGVGVAAYEKRRAENENSEN